MVEHASKLCARLASGLCAASFVLFLIAASSTPAKAIPCWGYIDGQAQCGGSCDHSYPTTRCGFGCVEGSCANTNTADCCRVAKYYAQIYSDGGICEYEECGLLANRQISFVKPADRIGPHIDLYNDRIPGQVMLAANKHSREPVFKYVFARCMHEYILETEEN